MRSLKRLGAAVFATSMLSTINVSNAKIFVGTNHVAESVNLIDKDLIGGFIIKVGDIQFDNSVNSSLNKLRTTLKKENSFI